MGGPAQKARGAISAAAYSNLRAAAGEGEGLAIRIPLSSIDEDPTQPRTVFDGDGLESLAASIRLQGVIQPVVVRPPVNGRYMLAWGARRFRASKLAGVHDIPATIRPRQPGDYAAQLMENQQREALRNSDLVRAIARLAGEGHNNRELAATCNLKDHEVSAYRQAGNFPPELRARIDNASMRALYDLYRQWQKTPDAVLRALPDAGAFLSVTDARRIIGGISGKATGSIVLERAPPPRAPASVPPIAADGTESHGERPRGDANPGPGKPAGEARPAPRILHGAKPAGGTAGAWPRQEPEAARRVPVFIVAGTDGEEGRLVLDKVAGRPGLALVEYGRGVAEMPPETLRIVRIE